MAEFNSSNAECFVYTYKEGLLSKMAHDLKIAVTDFSLTVDEANGTIEAQANPASLRVVCAVIDGKESPDTVSPDDKKKIEGNIAKDVLHTDKFPQITFKSASVADAEGGYRVAGKLTLHGVEKDVSVLSRKENGRQVVELPVHQPDFGIKPYSAMMGTLKIKPDIKIAFSVPYAR